MTQLILDVGGQALAMPESKKGGYTCDEPELLQNADMISGRRTREYRGRVWVITHQYGYLNDADMERFILACQAGSSDSILCSFLPQGATELQTALFYVTTYRKPKFMWSRVVTEYGEEVAKPVWGDYYVELREVKPHARSN